MEGTTREKEAVRNEPSNDRIVVVLQPGYLPWLGFFEQMSRAHVFVYYDDVPFDKHGWRNRNRVKAPTGKPHWLTVPIRHHGLGQPRIGDIELDRRAPWARKHIGTLRQFYARAAFSARYLPELEELLQRRWVRLVDLNLAVVELLCRWLGLARRVVRSSALGLDGERSERLLRICQYVGATCYYSGPAAQVYLDVSLFARHGITVAWQRYAHPVYPQLHGPFVAYLSVVDLILNCGPAAGGILLGRARCPGFTPTPSPTLCGPPNRGQTYRSAPAAVPGDSDPWW